MDAQTTVTVRCTACGKLGEVKPSCGCGAAFEYISPGELAAKAIVDNPGMSDRALADKLGIGAETVRRARKSTAPNEAVEPRVGKDGRKRRMPKDRKHQATRQRIRPAVTAGETVSRKKLAEELGVGENTIQRAEQYEQGRLEGLEDAIGLAAAKVLSMTAREKIKAALRQQLRAQRIEFEQRVAAEYTARVKKQFPDLEKMEREARDEKRTYERLLRESKKLGTLEEWKNLMVCLHPDTRRTASDEKFDAALTWVMKRKFAITGEK